MNKSKQFSSEVRERAVRLVQEHRGEYPSLWAAVESIAPKIGCVPSTLLTWVKRTEIDAGQRPGMSTAEAQRIKELEREVKELQRANEILKLASAGNQSQQRFANVWCGHCGHETTITNFSGTIKGGDLLLVGKCAECHGDVARVIEGA